MNFAFDQREIEINLHNATSLPTNVRPASRPFFKNYMMVKIYQPIKLQKTDTPKSISNIGKSWKDLFAYPLFAFTRQHLKTENNKLNIYWYTQYLMKSTFETIWLFFYRPVILYACVQFYTHQASDYRLSSKTVILYIYIEILRRAWPLIIYVMNGKRFNKLLWCCLKENTIWQYNSNVAC